MTTLFIKFIIDLTSQDFPSLHERHYGPLFHRWLPNGSNDKLTLDTGHPEATLHVWFERLGFVDNGFIEFDHKRKEVDPEIIPKQGVLEAGPLHGIFKITGLKDEVLSAVTGNKIGDPDYIALGKRAVKLLYPPVSRFINLFRTNYGQYWVRELEKWNSQEQSLGRYCDIILNLKWSLTENGDWNPFIPDKPEPPRVKLEISWDFQPFREYITQEDWQNIRTTIKSGYEPPLAALVLQRAHKLSDQGDIKYALIEGVTALELSLEDFMYHRLGNNQMVSDGIKSFWNLPLSARLIAITATMNKVPLSDIENALDAIKIRNDLVHDGIDPPRDAKIKLLGLLSCVAPIIPGPKFKFPKANHGNALKPPEDWDAGK